MKFTKMQGLGNDYIYINAFEEQTDDPPALARRMSDRHFGVGGDGLVLIAPSDKADFRMIMYNADGSRGAMCGNASRCFGKYLYERHLTDSIEIKLETLSGVKTLSLTLSPDRLTVTGVTVDMLQPAFHQASQYDEQVGLDAHLVEGLAEGTDGFVGVFASQKADLLEGATIGLHAGEATHLDDNGSYTLQLIFTRLEFS